jgi:hypothetical protein
VEVDVRTCSTPSPQRDGHVDGVEAARVRDDAVDATVSAPRARPGGARPPPRAQATARSTRSRRSTATSTKDCWNS